MILKCNGLQYDDRVRKECETLKKLLNLHTEIHVVQDENKLSKGTIFKSESTFKSYYLISRSLFSGNTMLLLKLLELFFRILPTLFEKRKAVWLHDPIMFVFVPLLFILKKMGRLEYIVWDQHELPPNYFISNSLFRWFYKFAMKLVDVRIHANSERGDYLNNLLDNNYNYKVLNNFVDESFVNEKSASLDPALLDWLDGDDFVLLQSGAYDERNFKSVVEAFTKYKMQKCVVVGGQRINLSYFRKKYSNFDEVFFFVGMVPQIRLVDFIDKSKASLILYKSTIKNAFYCEPNRLYQASCRGTFVIVGNNPPMARFVKRNGNGYILEDDGSNSEYIFHSLKFINSNKVESKVVISDWSTQDEVFLNLFD